MNLKIKLLKPFSDAAGESEVSLEFMGRTLEEVCGVLADMYPGLKKEFYDEGGGLTDYLSIFVNDRPSSALNDMDTELSEGDELTFFMPISGG